MRKVEGQTVIIVHPCHPFAGQRVAVLHHRPRGPLQAFLHVHRRCDYWIGDTRVICNPRGVGDESVDEFDPLFAIDVG